MNSSGIKNLWLESFEEYQDDTVEFIFEDEMLGDPIIFNSRNRQYWIQNAMSLQYSCRGVYYNSTQDTLIPIGVQLQKKDKDEGLKDLFFFENGTEKAFFLDRDGVVNIDYGYIFKAEDLKWKTGVFDLVQSALHNQYKVIILTNQSGIGRGYYKEEDVKGLHSLMNKTFVEKALPLTAWYYCPYHEDALIQKYRRRSYLRKPMPGMALMAQRDWNIDFSQSLMVGDKKTDHFKGIFLETYLLQGNYDLGSYVNQYANHFELIKALQEKGFLRKE